MLIKFCDIIDKLNEWTGEMAAWLILPMCFIVTYDVILRYAFNSPTIWAWDINTQLLGAMVALGGAYALLHDGHVGVDVILVLLSRKKRIVVELVTSLFFFLGSGVLLWNGLEQAAISVKTMEVDYTYFAPPVYPLKVLIAVGFLLLFLEGISKFIRNIVAYGQREGDNR
ncbi:MAG: TRAP transporter small permease subunit [Deltaproteobacteria bacterium]|nr:TRAP transporter small permease subunit [Deltaproteobacteria bacterium]